MKPNYYPRLSTRSQDRFPMNTGEQALPGRHELKHYCVKDLISGRTFIVRSAPCNLPHCRCDAVIVREVF